MLVEMQVHLVGMSINPDTPCLMIVSEMNARSRFRKLAAMSKKMLKLQYLFISLINVKEILLVAGNEVTKEVSWVVDNSNEPLPVCEDIRDVLFNEINEIDGVRHRVEALAPCFGCEL